MYEESYILYDECNKMIESHISDISFLKRKATNKDIVAMGGFVVGILGLLVGIVSIFVGLT